MEPETDLEEPMRTVDAVFVESFFGGSHRAFARGWLEHSRHDWRLVSLPDERWKWRLRSAAMVLGPRLALLDPPPQVVVATSLIDLAHLRQLSGLDRLRRPPAFLLYMHENQFSYPRPAGQALDRSFAGAHLASWMAADGVAWNSRSHRQAAVESVRAYLGQIPPPRPRGLLGRLAGRDSRVLHPGVDLRFFPEPGPRGVSDRLSREDSAAHPSSAESRGLAEPAGRPAGKPPVIVWNHRWDGDKRPGAFARILIRLADKGHDFRLVLLGMVDQVSSSPLETIRERLGGRILRDGPARTRREYAAWLSRADLTVSTAEQENFGYAAVEAMAAGAVPLFPRRLSYPELLPAGLRKRLLYRTDRELASRLGQWLERPEAWIGLREPVMRAARHHAWPERAAALDEWVEEALP